MTAQLSREELQRIAETDHVQCGDAAAMARVLLAGMDSEPVYQLSESWNGKPFSGWKDCTKEEFDAAIQCGCERMRRVLYASPTAPVSPNVSKLGDQEGYGEKSSAFKNCLNCQRHGRITHYCLKNRCPECGSSKWDIAKPLCNTREPAAVPDSLIADLLVIAKNAASDADECAHAEFNDDSEKHANAIADWERRAAMLNHGTIINEGTMQAEPVTSWIKCSERMPPLKTGVIVGKWMGRLWATKWATYIPSHPEANPYGYIMPGGSWCPSHWMPLPAAPEQEV